MNSQVDLPIGVFDSGLGGLTVAREIMRTMPNEKIIYLGDTARVPYGNRSKDTIVKFTHEAVNYLINQGVKSVVVACATASSVALMDLSKTFTVYIEGVIDATATMAAKTTSNGKIGVMGTRATVGSGSFVSMLQSFGISKLQVSQVACPLLVPVIEEGILAGKIVEEVLDLYVPKLLSQGVDTIILGCTHYPLLLPELTRLYPTVKFINPGIAVAERVRLKFLELGITSLNEAEIAPDHRYLVSDLSPAFAGVASKFLGKDVLLDKVDM